MKREAGEGSEKKQTSIGRDEFRKQQDIEREKFRKELQERGSSKKTIKVIGWIVFGVALYLLLTETNILWSVSQGIRSLYMDGDFIRH